MSYQGTQQKIHHKYSEPHFKTVYQEEKKNPQESREYNGHVPPAPIYNIHQNPISIHQNPVTINHHTVTNIQQPQQSQQPQQFQQPYGEKYRPKPPEYFHSNIQR
jgi:FtsZ-interacting cell division protein ZipA